MPQPLRATEAKALARQILDGGTVIYTKHCLARMEERSIDILDVENVLRGGAYGEAEWENGDWRHRAWTQKFEVIVVFDDETRMIIVTAIRRSS